MSARTYELYFSPHLLGDEEAPLARFISALQHQDLHAAWELVEDVADDEDLAAAFDGDLEITAVDGALMLAFDTRSSVSTDFVLEVFEALHSPPLEGCMENSQNGQLRYWLDGQEVDADAPFRWLDSEETGDAASW